MRILIVSYEFPPYVGGAGTYARDLAVGLARKGCQVHILTCVYANHASSVAEDAELNHKVKVYRIAVFGKTYLFQLFIRLRLLLSVYRYDLIVFSDAGANKMASFFQVFLERVYGRSLSVFHGSEIDNFFVNPSRALRVFRMPRVLRRHYNKLHGIIAVSAAMKRTLVKAIPSVEAKTQIILHGIDDEMFVPLSEAKIAVVKKSLGLNETASYIFSASRLVLKKGQDTVIKAFSEIKKKYDDLFLVISGDGPAKKELEAQAEAYGLGSKVIFTGAVGRKRMAELYGASEMFVLLSRRLNESFGLVFLEANACGRVVVGGRIGGVMEAVEEEVSGFTVTPEDWCAAAGVIEQLLDNERLRRKLEYSARKRLLDFYTCGAMAERLLDTFVINN
jgi:glycosyltransferase involved in cell wall biosynthesis